MCAARARFRARRPSGPSATRGEPRRDASSPADLAERRGLQPLGAACRCAPPRRASPARRCAPRRRRDASRALEGSAAEAWATSGSARRLWISGEGAPEQRRCAARVDPARCAAANRRRRAPAAWATRSARPRGAEPSATAAPSIRSPGARRPCRAIRQPPLPPPLAQTTTRVRARPGEGGGNPRCRGTTRRDRSTTSGARTRPARAPPPAPSGRLPRKLSAPGAEESGPATSRVRFGEALMRAPHRSAAGELALGVDPRCWPRLPSRAAGAARLARHARVLTSSPRPRHRRRLRAPHPGAAGRQAVSAWRP